MKKMLRNLLRRKASRPTTSHSEPVIHAGSNMSVLYQTWGLSGGALWYIDQGYQNALSEGGYQWATWDPNDDPQTLIKTIKKLEPECLLLTLQTIQRQASSWTEPEILQQLVELKESLGFKVACRSHPSNLDELFQQYPIDFSQFKENVRSFYQQPQHPDVTEQAVFECGFIDVIRTAFFHGTFEVGFRNYLDLGCKVLEEPHAADLTTYQTDSIAQSSSQKADFDLLFVGGCWPFKWQNMQPYVEALKKKFGDRFRIYGQNWPDNLSCGYLAEEDFNSTLRQSKINITLHELSQTLAEPISGNERVFKLGALNCFALSDANPLIEYHFDVDQEVAYCGDAEQMIERAEFFLANPDLRDQRVNATYQKVLNEHSYRRRIEQIWHACESPEQVTRYNSIAKPVELVAKVTR